MSIIVLDAGHGGHDSGAVGNQLKEKDLVLDLVLRVGEELSKYECEVVYTRNDDTFVTIPDRVRIAREAKASCLISFHINAHTSMTAQGFESFIRNGSGIESHKLQQAIHFRLAEKWVKAGRNDRGIKKADFGVLRNEPSILIEFGFISNYLDAELLVDESFVRGQVQAVVDGLVDYLKLKVKEPVKATVPDKLVWYEKFNKAVFK
jgi:N-acetylmuramoyl-L-alanine amidase